MRWRRLFTTVAILALGGCSGGSSPTQPGDVGVTVAVRNNLFAPATLQVPVNRTVTWQWNSGGVEHNVTFETGPSSENQTSGSFPRLFQTAGTYGYVCTIHGAVMSGVVTVTAGTGGTGGGGPDGGGGGYGP